MRLNPLFRLRYSQEVIVHLYLISLLN